MPDQPLPSEESPAGPLRDQLRAAFFALFVAWTLAQPVVSSQLFAIATSEPVPRELILGLWNASRWFGRVAVLGWLMWCPQPQPLRSATTILLLLSLTLGISLDEASQVTTASLGPVINSTLVALGELAIAGVLIAGVSMFRRFEITEIDKQSPSAGYTAPPPRPWSVRGMLLSTFVVAVSLAAFLRQQSLWEKHGFVVTFQHWLYPLSNAIGCAMLAAGLGLALTRRHVVTGVGSLALVAAVTGWCSSVVEYFLFDGQVFWLLNFTSSVSITLLLAGVAAVARALGYGLR